MDHRQSNQNGGYLHETNCQLELSPTKQESRILHKEKTRNLLSKSVANFYFRQQTSDSLNNNIQKHKKKKMNVSLTEARLKKDCTIKKSTDVSTDYKDSVREEPSNNVIELARLAFNQIPGTQAIRETFTLQKFKVPPTPKGNPTETGYKRAISNSPMPSMVVLGSKKSCSKNQQQKTQQVHRQPQESKFQKKAISGRCLTRFDSPVKQLMVLIEDEEKRRHEQPTFIKRIKTEQCQTEQTTRRSQPTLFFDDKKKKLQHPSNSQTLRGFKEDARNGSPTTRENDKRARIFSQMVQSCELTPKGQQSYIGDPKAENFYDRVMNYKKKNRPKIQFVVLGDRSQ